MRLPDSGRYAHPAVRPSSWRHFELDEHQRGTTICRVSGDLLNTAAAEITEAPFGPVRSPTGRAARFENGLFQGLWGTVPIDRSVEVLQGDWTVSVLFRTLQRPVFGERGTIFCYAGDASSESAANNFLMFCSVEVNGKPRMMWEHSGGTNVESLTTDYVIEPFEWTLLTWQKSNTTGVGPGGTCDLRLFVWGQQVESFSGITNCSDGTSGRFQIGSNEFGASASEEFEGDICGAYLWAEPLTPEQIAEDARRVRAQVFANHVDIRVDVASVPGEEPDTDLTDFENLDWVDAVTISDEVDKAMMTANVTLLVEQEHLSLSALRTDSKVNLLDVFDPTSYLPLLDLARRIDIFAARVPLGLRGGDGDWFSVFSGFIDEFDEGGAEKVSLTCRDLGAELMDTFIEEEIVYGAPVPGTAIEGEMQFILNDNDNDPLNNSVTGLLPRSASYDPVTLHTPLSPVFTLVEDEQRRESVLSALRTKAGLIAWECRYMFDQDPNENRWRLTFFEPRRLRPDIGDIDAVIAPDDILDITSLKRSLFGIRTSCRVVYPSSEPGPSAPVYAGTLPGSLTIEDQDWQDLDGEDNRVMAFIQIRNPDAETRINRRAFMEIAEASSSQIDTIQEAGDMCVGALLDTGEEDLGKSFTMPLMPEMERNDMIRFNPNPQRFTAAQVLAVKSFQMSWNANGQGQSTVQARGRPSAGFKRWLRLETRGPGQAGAITPFETLSDQHLTGINTAVRAILDKTGYLQGGKYLAVRNPNFQFFSAGLENEPDGWTLVGGTWGGTSGSGPRTAVGLSQSGGYSVNLDTSDVGVLTSDFIPLDSTDYTPLGLEVIWQRASIGGVPRVTLRFYDEDKNVIEPLGTLHSNRGLHPTENKPHWEADNVHESRFVANVVGAAGPTTTIQTSPAEGIFQYAVGDVVDYVGRISRGEHNVRRGEVTARQLVGMTPEYTLTPNDETPAAAGGGTDDGAVGWRPPFWQADNAAAVHPIDTWFTSRQIGIDPPSTDAKFVRIELEAINVTGFSDIFFDTVQLFRLGRATKITRIQPNNVQYGELRWVHIRHTMPHRAPAGATATPENDDAMGYDYGDNYRNEGLPDANSELPHFFVKEPGLLEADISFATEPLSSNPVIRARLRLVRNMTYDDGSGGGVIFDSNNDGEVLAYSDWVDNTNQLGLPAADQLVCRLNARVQVSPGDRVNAEVYVEVVGGAVASAVIQDPETNFSVYKMVLAD